MPPPSNPKSLFNQSHPISPLSLDGQHVPPHLFPPYHRSYMPSKPRIKQPISENANLIDLSIRHSLSQQQNVDERHSRNRTNSFNGKGDRSKNGRSSPPSILIF